MLEGIAQLGRHFLGQTGRCQEAVEAHHFKAFEAGLNSGRHFRQRRVAFLAGHRQCADLALLVIRGGLRNALRHELHLTTNQVGKRRGAALVGDVHQIRSGRVLVHLRHQMADTAVTGRAEVDAAGVGLGVGRELAQRLGRHLVIHQQCQRLHGGTGDGREVFERVVGQLAVERRVNHHHAGIGQHQRVAIRRRTHDILRTHRTTCTGLVVHHQWLAQHALQLVRQQSGVLIQRATCGEAQHDANGLGGEGIVGMHAHRHQQTGTSHQAGQNGTDGFIHYLSSFGF